MSREPLLLRQLGNDCEERAHGTGDQDARAILAIVARKARMAAMSPHLSIEGRRAWLASLSDLSSLALWLEDAGITGTVSPFVRQSLENHRTSLENPASPADSLSVTGESALTAAQLASALCINERTVRRAIEQGAAKGLPGFYRDGWRWLADRDAFEAAMSELCPRVSRKLQHGHDGENHTQAA